LEHVIVPRKLIEDKSLGDKRVLFYLSISLSHWNGNSIDELIRFCGYSAKDKHMNSPRCQLIQAVEDFSSKGYMERSGHCPQLLRPDDRYGKIYVQEFQRIMDSRRIKSASTMRFNHAHLLLTLAYIRCHMLPHVGAPRIYSNLIIRIADYIGISERSVANCARALEQLDILHSEELPRYQDGNGHWHSNVRIFVDKQIYSKTNHTYDWQNETQRGIRMILTNQID